MNRKAEIFFDAITRLREDLVEEAQNYTFRKKRAVWRKFASLAACVMLVVSLGMLAALPKGCGSAGGGDSSAPMASDESEANVGAPSGDGSMFPAPSDAPPSSEAKQIEFCAQVLEVREDGLLVEPFDGLPADVERVRVPTAGLEDLPEFYPGGTVTVVCGSVSQGEGEAVAEAVAAVWLTEPDSP